MLNSSLFFYKAQVSPKFHAKPAIILTILINALFLALQSKIQQVLREKSGILK